MGLYDDREELGPGRRLGRYELISPIGEGGMGRVWAARMEGTHGFRKVVAIKTVSPAVAADPDAEKMLLNEAQLASQVHHRHVVEILDLGEEAGTLYIVMEWVDGESLQRVIRAGGRGMPLSPWIAARIAADAAAGLHAAHELTDDAGSKLAIVHRDVSPQNILVGRDGTVKVVDFGIAKALGGVNQTTRTGELKGKLSYMSPEQVASAPVDRRSDIFSLGIVLFEMLTGARPFVSDHELGVLTLIANAQAPAPSASVPSVPRELDRVVLTALARDPVQRFQTAEDFSLALEHCLSRAGQVVTAGHLAATVRERCGNKHDSARQRFSQSRPSRPDGPAVATPANLSASLPADALAGNTLAGRPALPRVLPWIVAAFATALAAVAVLVLRSATGPATAPPAASSVVHRDGPITVRVRPAAAQVTVGGAPAGSGDQRIARPLPGAPVEVKVRLDGYGSTTLVLHVDDPDEIQVELSKALPTSLDLPPVAITSQTASPAPPQRGHRPTQPPSAGAPEVSVPANPY